MIKFKTPDINTIKISIDRLTRFKPVLEKYERVFDDILSKFLISHDKKISETAITEKAEIASRIINSAIVEKTDLKLNEIIKTDEEKIFYLTDIEKELLNSKIDFEGALKMFELKDLPLNLKRLKIQACTGFLPSHQTRENFLTLFPVSKVILVEGITEEILLIEFAKKMGLDFNKEGIYCIGAGGKNQVARKYYKLIEEIKIPIFILLDFDADEIFEIIKPKLRKKDKLYKIQAGEFEDILPKNLIKNALNLHFAENLLKKDNNFEDTGHRVDELNLCYKNNGWGEFKKADFAKIVREYLLQTENPPISRELTEITNKIKEM